MFIILTRWDSAFIYRFKNLVRRHAVESQTHKSSQSELDVHFQQVAGQLVPFTSYRFPEPMALGSKAMASI